MRRLVVSLAIVGVVAGVFYALSGGGLDHFGQTSQAAAAAKVAQKATVSRPADTDVRMFLAPAQQAQASTAGGFVQQPKSLLRITRRMHYGDFVWNDGGVPPGPISIRVDLRTQMLSVFRGGHEIGTAVALYGADSKETPIGTFPILWKGRDHVSSLYDAPMPFTLRLTGDGVAIHGSNVRWGAATHGCVGIPTEFARRVYEEAKIGDLVAIVRTAAIS